MNDLNQGDPNYSDDKYLARFGLLVLVLIGVITYTVGNLPNVETFVLILTLVAVALNTGETRKMQKEMVRQTRLSIMPGFTVEYFKDGPSESLRLINIGNGVATNITFDPLDVPYLVIDKMIIYTVRFKGISYIHKTAVQDLEFQIFATVGLIDNNAFWILKDAPPGYPSSIISFSLRISFQDIEGNIYMQNLEIDKTGCKPGKVLPT